MEKSCLNQHHHYHSTYWNHRHLSNGTRKRERQRKYRRVVIFVKKTKELQLDFIEPSDEQENRRFLHFFFLSVCFFVFLIALVSMCVRLCI